jgi:tRNA(Ile)-lysidine synthase
MNRTAGELEEAECFIQKAVQEAGSRCTAGHGTGESRQICINIPAFLQEDRYLQGRILLSCLEDMTDTRKDITAVHIGNILKFLEGTGSGELHLPYGLMVCRNYDMAVIKRRQKEEERVPEKEKIFLPKEEQLPCSIPVPGLGNVEISLFSYEKSQEIPQKTYTKWFDYDKITKYAVFRVREKGDFLTINSKMDKKSLQDYFINEKIPKGGRDTLYVLADGPHILWVPGYRISEYYKVSEKTRRVLQVHVEKEKGVETWLRK